jgi:hypothetical protein
LILICSFALAWATRTKPAQPLVAHTNQAPMGGRPVHHATHNHRMAAGKTHTDHRQGALSNFKEHTKQPTPAGHSKGAGQGANHGGGGGSGLGANQGAVQGADQGAVQGADQGAGHGANFKSDTSPTPTPEENLSPTSDTTLGSSATIPGTSRWPRAAATPAPLP